MKKGARLKTLDLEALRYFLLSKVEDQGSPAFNIAFQTKSIIEYLAEIKKANESH